MKNNENNTLVEVIDRVLDKGLVINADITISLVNVELLNIRLRAALASFETAAKFGLAFPTGTNLNAPAWKELGCEKMICPQCGNQLYTKSENICSCGWGNISLQQGKKEKIKLIKVK